MNIFCSRRIASTASSNPLPRGDPGRRSRNFLNVTLRYVDADPVAVLACAPQKRFAAVMSFSQEDRSPEGEVDMMRMTEALIEGVKDPRRRVLSAGYRLHARRDQVRSIYPLH